ncbi:MAG: type II toxin-antitoxin system PemK/MazF family toxin [Sporichthyaceae bacterium]
MSQSAAVRPWQVWWVDLGNPIGHEQGGRRPAVVVSSSTHLRFPIGMVLVVPITGRDRGLAHHVRLDSPGSGLDRPSWARTEDIRAISMQRLAGRAPIGTASPTEISQLETWLREMVAFGRAGN